MEFLERDIIVGGRKVSILRLIIFIGSTIGLVAWSISEIIVLAERSYLQTYVGVPGGYRGWIGQRWRDYNDEQWTSWIDSLRNLSLTFAVFLAVSNGIRHLIEQRRLPKQAQMMFYFVTGLLGGFFIHGTEVLWPLFFISINYLITKAVRRLPEGLAVLIIWIYNSFVLFSVFLVNYPRIIDLFPFMNTVAFGYTGFSRWSVYYKLAMLRQISFGIDFQQAYRKAQRPSLSSETGVSVPTRYELAELRQFTLPSLIGYTFYLPLLIAGPIAPFSQFARDCEKRQTQVSLRSIFRMLVQVAFYTLALEVWLHFIYVYSWNKSANWADFPPAVLSMICFWTLQHMFIKFLIIWRSFRVVALLDGISTTENMQRCISNTASFQGFWRSWHASFSEWLMRYIYLPLGGRNRRVLSLWLIFLFVGAWHDLDYNWMAFAIFNAVGISIESLVHQWVYKSGQQWIDTSRTNWKIRITEVVIGALNVAVLTLANFAINHGFEKTKNFVYYMFFHSYEGPVNFLWRWIHLILMVANFYSYPGNITVEESKEPSKKLS